MSERDRVESPRDHEGTVADDQAIIDEVGRSGTVPTHGGETSVGTTPVGLGSVEPVGHHREAADRIMGRTEEEHAETPDDQSPGARPAAGRDR
jgi:hypothetical protein